MAQFSRRQCLAAGLVTMLPMGNKADSFTLREAHRLCHAARLMEGPHHYATPPGEWWRFLVGSIYITGRPLADQLALRQVHGVQLGHPAFTAVPKGGPTMTYLYFMAYATPQLSDWCYCLPEWLSVPMWDRWAGLPERLPMFGETDPEAVRTMFHRLTRLAGVRHRDIDALVGLRATELAKLPAQSGDRLVDACGPAYRLPALWGGTR